MAEESVTPQEWIKIPYDWGAIRVYIYPAGANLMSFFRVFSANIRNSGFAVRRVARSLIVIASLSGLSTTANAADDTFSCLNELTGPLLDVQGTENVDNDWFNMENGTRLDARGDVFTSETFPSIIAQYPVDIRVWDGRLVTECWVGGAILSTNPLDITWRDSKNGKGDGIGSHNVSLIVDGARVHNAHDGFAFWTRDGGRPEIYWQIRNSWVTYNRDDCIENDFYFGGLVDDSLFDGCYVFLSTRGGTTAYGQTVTVRNSLIRMQQMPGPYGYDDSSVMGHGEIFKTSEYGTDIALENNIFLVEGLAKTGAESSLWPAQNFYLLGFKDRITSCSNNVIVWLGEGPYPGNIPDDPSCITVTTDRTVWDNARAAWLAGHPLVARLYGVDDPAPQQDTALDPAPELEPDPEPTPEPDPDITLEPAPEPDSTVEPAPDTTDETRWFRKDRKGSKFRDGQSPSVDIISPIGGTKVFPSTSLWVEVDVSDNVGVARLEVYINRGPPYIFEGDGTHGFAWVVDNSRKWHVINALAYDESGNKSVDRIRVFTVR